MRQMAPLNKLFVVGFLLFSTNIGLQKLAAETDGGADNTLLSSDGENSSKVDEMISSEGGDISKPVSKKTDKKQKTEKANSFVAGSDWEFDGFVAGGQDEAIKSMFHQGDTVYLNIGSQQGLNSGDRLHIFKRGGKIKDPQTGRFMGFEVRLAAIAQVTDRIDVNACSVRLIKSNEAVEIGDLSKRIE